MLKFFGENFSSCVWLAVVIVAMIPTVESIKDAIRKTYNKE